MGLITRLFKTKTSVQGIGVDGTLATQQPSYVKSDGNGGGANNYGSTSTKIRRLGNASNVIVGTAITYADSATLGTSYTINEDGVYSITYCDSTATFIAIGLNSYSSGTTDASAIPYAQRLTKTAVAGAAMSATIPLKKGDIICAHGGASSAGTNDVIFLICQVIRF